MPRYMANPGDARPIFLLSLVVLTQHAMPVRASEDGSRSRLDLNGIWEFRMDPSDEGIRQQWFTPSIPYPDRIRVPGNWQAQGFGPARGHLRHDYQGKAWYRRSVRVPADWSGKRIWLHLGGVTNTAEVYVNGRKVGFVDGFLTPYEFDVTEAIKPNTEAVIACRVDSTGPAPVGMFNFIGRWGGLYRGAFLESRSDPAIDDVFVVPDVKSKTARVHITVRRRSSDGEWQGRVTAEAAPLAGGTASRTHVPVRFHSGQTDSEPAVLDLRIEDMHPWSPEDPFLYALTVTLMKEDMLLDVVRDRFGMRQFEVAPGGRLLLNGKPYFVRGIGDDSVEVITGTPHPDKQVFIDRIRRIKQYGFNGTRFLAHTPIKEYFEAADEVGFLVMGEGEIYNRDAARQVLPLLRKQVSLIAKACRNHPSWYVWSAGNEFFECQGPTPERTLMDYVLDAHATFKKLDPTRFFVASDGTDIFPTDIITQRAKFDTGPVPEQPFDGWIDEVAYFKRALSEAELAVLACAEGHPAAEEYVARVKSLQPSACWRLDETSPCKAADTSGHGLDGAYDPTMTASELNQPGSLERAAGNKAIRVNAQRTGVSLKTAAPSAFAKGNEPFSVSLWVRPAAFRKGDWGSPFSCGAAAERSGFIIALDGLDGTGHICLGQYGRNFLKSTSPLKAGQWNHIGVSHDGRITRLFLDGKPAGQAAVNLATVVVDGRIGGLIRFGPEASEYQKRPHIWHEFPNTYVGTLPDLTIADKWTGVFQDDRCISFHRQQVADLGIADRYVYARQRSIDLFYLYLKGTFEQARHSQTMDGYAYWCLTDFPGGPEGDMPFYGIFSTVYEPEKFPDPRPVLRFNRDTVLLIDAPAEQRILAADESRSVTVTLSHYGEKPISDGRLSWRVDASDVVRQQGTIDLPCVATGEVRPIGTVTLGPYRPEIGERLRLRVELTSSSCRQENEWDFWVFPARKRGLAGGSIVNLTASRAIDERYTAGPALSQQTQLVVTNRLSAQALDYLKQGGTVILLAEKGALACPKAFSFWPQWIRSTGTFVEKHPALDGFPHEGFCAFQFYRLFGDGLEALNITEKGSTEREKLTAIVWGLNQDANPRQGTDWANVANRWKLFRYGLVSEGRIGSGRILICSLRALAGMELRHPEAGYLLDCLISYAMSPTFAPTSPAMSVEECERIITVK